MKYIVTSTDPKYPLGEMQVAYLAEKLDEFLRLPSGRVLTFTDPVNIYVADDDGEMRLVGGQGAQPFRLSDTEVLVPITESADRYTFTGYELWRLTDGQWAKVQEPEHVPAIA